MATSSSVVKEIKIIVDAGKATVSIDGMTSSISKANAELVKLSKNAGKGKAASGATGGATATVLELGRTISDSNYGIRGMANNLSQLVSNLAFTTKAAGGFAAGLKSIWSAMMGPLGLVLAFQGVIALLERFEINSMKASSASKDLDDSLKDEITTLGIYKSALLDVNTTLQERVGIIKGLSALDNKLAEDLKNAAGNTKEIVNITEKYIEQLTLQEKLSLKKIELNEAIAESTKLVEDKEKDLQDIRNIANADIDEKSREALRLSVATNITNAQEKQNKVLSEYLLLWSKVTSNEKKSAKESKKVFKQRNLDLSKEMLKYQRDEELATEENEFKKLEIKQRYERQDLENKKKSFIEKERLRLENFLKTTENEAKIAEAKATFNKMELQAEKEHQDALTELTMTQASKRFNFQLEIARESTKKYQEAVDAGEIQALTFGMTQDAGVDALNAEAILLQAQYDQKVYWLDEEIKERKRDGDSYMDLIKQKLNAEKKFRNDTVVLTEKTEEAKRGIVALGFQAIAQIAEKGSAINKAASVAAALMSTYEAANSALGAKPYGPWNIAQAAIVTAMGLANVSSILKTPTPTKDGGTSTSEGAGGGRTFDFNLVGSTGTNQLAEAVGSQFQEPVQAYVVSSQMTSQQELDLQISTGASLGGD